MVVILKDGTSESNIVDIDDGDVQVQEEAGSGEKEPADKK